MTDRITTPEIIDIVALSLILLMGLLGSWRGVVKELFISVAVLLSLMVSSQWSMEWADRLAGQFDMDPADAELFIRVMILIVGPVFIGYVASVNAGIPPADVPGRVGGFIVGAINAVVLISALSTTVYALQLSDAQRQTIQDTRLISAMIDDFDLIILVIAALALVLAFASATIRRRRMSILGPSESNRPAASGFQIRRDKPLAPEAEKIETTSAKGYGTGMGRSTGTPLGETVPITRVSDPSSSLDRPVPASGSRSDGDAAIPINAEAVRCLSCGERLTDDDKFCPRCGRSLVR